MSSRLKELVITDSILPTESVKNARNIRVLPIAPLLGEAIARTSEEQSSRCRACSTSRSSAPSCRAKFRAYCAAAPYSVI
jgi:hypothetical protein